MSVHDSITPSSVAHVTSLPAGMAITALSIDDAPAVIDVIVEAFFTGQLDYEGNDEADFREYLAYMCARCAETGLGFVARCTQTNTVIGSVLCNDLVETFQSEFFQDDFIGDPMMGLLKQLNQQYFTSFDIAPNTYLNVKFIGVDARFAGNGVAVALLQAVLAQGVAQQFTFAHTESAGRRSQYVFGKKMGFEDVATLNYADYVFQGTTPFVPSEDHQSIQLMIKALG